MNDELKRAVHEAFSEAFAEAVEVRTGLDMSPTDAATLIAGFARRMGMDAVANELATVTDE